MATQEKHQITNKTKLRIETYIEAKNTLAAFIGDFYHRTRYIGSTEMNTLFKGFNVLLNYFKFERDTELEDRITKLEEKLPHEPERERELEE